MGPAFVGRSSGIRGSASCLCAGSDKIDVGAKGVITREARDGVVFARYRKLKGLLKIHDGKRNFDVINAQKKFDAFSPEALLK